MINTLDMTADFIKLNTELDFKIEMLQDTRKDQLMHLLEAHNKCNLHTHMQWTYESIAVTEFELRHLTRFKSVMTAICENESKTAADLAKYITAFYKETNDMMINKFTASHSTNVVSNFNDLLEGKVYAKFCQDSFGGGSILRRFANCQIVKS